MSYDIVIFFSLNKVSGVGLVEFVWIGVSYGDEYFSVVREGGIYWEVVVDGGNLKYVDREEGSNGEEGVIWRLGFVNEVCWVCFVYIIVGIFRNRGKVVIFRINVWNIRLLGRD